MTWAKTNTDTGGGFRVQTSGDVAVSAAGYFTEMWRELAQYDVNFSAAEFP